MYGLQVDLESCVTRSKRCIPRSVGQSAGLLILRSSVRFRQKFKKTENSNLYGFEVHRPSNKGTKLLLQVIKAIINQGFSPKKTKKDRDKGKRNLNVEIGDFFWGLHYKKSGGSAPK